MANTKVGLMRRVKTEKGWGHYPAVYAANGRVKPGVVLVGGTEVKHAIGHYELRFYQGSKIVFESLKGITPAAAEDKRKKKEAQMSVVVAAGKADVAIVPIDSKRKKLTDQLALFVAAALGRGAKESAEVNKRAVDEFLAITGKDHADEITIEDFGAYYREMTKRGRSKRTVHNRDSNVKSFLRYCGYDTKELPKAPKYDKTMPEIYADEELSALFGSITDPKQNLLYRTLLGTGIREQEAMHLEWDDVDAQTKTLRIHSKPKWDFRVKDFEERALPLGDDLLARIQAYRTAHPGSKGPIFDRQGQPDGHMLRTLKRLVKDGGLGCGTCDGCQAERSECEKWFLHKFRASYCTKLLRSGLDLRTVQAMMGHADLASTMRYLRPAENEQTQARINTINWG